MKTGITLLAEVASGRIEIVFNGLFNTIQFNSDCTDALPYCRAACCRLRSGYNVLLQEDEVDKYDSVPHPNQEGKFILKSKEEDLSCIYLDSEKSMCTIHETKPWACKVWHCSPEGSANGEEPIQYRDGGWILTPALGNLQDEIRG